MSRWTTRAASVAFVGTCALVVFACSDDEPMTLGYGVTDDAAPPFIAPDADGIDANAEPRAYCPSDKCPEGVATCPSSRFPCDVNLRTSRDNCGACGVACPEATPGETFECIDGRCAMRCDIARAMDCDGIIDNGCESWPSDDTTCGACGVVCSDPAKPCIYAGSGYACGCPSGQLTCLDPFPHCVKPGADDRDCGACGTRCDPNGDGGPLPTNAYYGCVGGKCGGFKCEPDYGNCDGDTSNGCETSLTTRDNCSVCGNACPAGVECLWSIDGFYQCMCPPGLTYCDGSCVDLATDQRNCGACGLQCHDDHKEASFGVCTYGICSRQCAAGRADCNGDPEDDCEVNTKSDPRNCGGCGIVCDAIAGQACVVGHCVVEPCEPGDGGPVAR